MAAGELRLGDLQVDGDDVYWVEARASEQGRCAVVRWRDSRADDAIAAPWSARTRVHEYGGGALLAAHGMIYFSSATDGRLYSVGADGGPAAVTPELGDVRYADMELDPMRDRLLCVVEDHRGARVINELRAVPTAGGEPEPLVAGNDFYSTPRVSPDGTQLLWLTWNQPNMPWDGTELWLADLDGTGAVRGARMIAGGPRDSIFQPSWAPDGALYFCSDRTGWWNLYRGDADGTHAVAPMEAECGRPQWVFRMSAYAFCAAGGIAMAVIRDGLSRLMLLDTASGSITDVAAPFTTLSNIDTLAGGVVAIAAAPDMRSSVVAIDVVSGEHTILRSSSDTHVDDDILSTAQAITFPGEGGATAHAFFYAPRNAAYAAPPGELPPLLVGAHGGPTSERSSGLDPLVQFWTSRGFAYLDVNYGGSTGYGRAYRERLRGASGVVDVGDCVAGARHLAATGAVDPAVMLIHGGSAGGYIVLCALAFHDAFAAGTSLYGIADLEVLHQETHKFEAFYDDSLVGPYPEQRELYRQRSPIHFIARVHAALLLLQGTDDPVVPPNQTQMMFDALRAADAPCACIIFPGEQHGFRDAGNIRRAIEAELSFYGQVLGIDIADHVEPVEIANLDRV